MLKLKVRRCISGGQWSGDTPCQEFCDLTKKNKRFATKPLSNTSSMKERGSLKFDQFRLNLPSNGLYTSVPPPHSVRQLEDGKYKTKLRNLLIRSVCGGNQVSRSRLDHSQPNCIDQSAKLGRSSGQFRQRRRALTPRARLKNGRAHCSQSLT